MLELMAALLLAAPPAEPSTVKPLPPSLTNTALCEELKRTAKERRSERAQIAGEREELRQQKQKLEVLAGDIEKQRQSLREETMRLQTLIDQELAAARKAPRKVAAKGKK
jgi:predicted  nucleic acid-binding Zn-ribbon protein